MDEATGLLYQPHIYELALYLAERSGASTIIDIGCGNGSKLKKAIGKYNIIGVDFGQNGSLFRSNVPEGIFYEVNLNRCSPQIPKDIIKDCIVICSDVIEHLFNLKPIVSYLSKLFRLAKYVLISTPDRIKSRGVFDSGPPANSAHVREWTIDELYRLFKDNGFARGLWGYTVNTDYHLHKSVIFYLGGREVNYDGCCKQVRVCGILSSYNDEDIIKEVITHYLK